MPRACSPRARGLAAWALLASMGAGCLVVGGLVIADLVASPRDLWPAACFAVGALAGWAWHRRG